MIDAVRLLLAQADVGTLARSLLVMTAIVVALGIAEWQRMDGWDREDRDSEGGPR